VPGDSGHGTIATARAAVNRCRRRLARRIIFTCGEGDSEEIRRLARDQGSPVVLKPFRIEELERAIAGVLRN
jgi:DNA-binding response OmpR family regulator